MKFCPNCGAKIPRPGEDQFCMSCGGKLPVLPPESSAPPLGGITVDTLDQSAVAPAPSRALFDQDAPDAAPPQPAAKSVLFDQDSPDSTPIFSGVPITPGGPATAAAPSPAQPEPSAQGEDLLSLIEEAQSKSAPAGAAPTPEEAPQQHDLFEAAEQALDNLFTQNPEAAQTPADGFFAGQETPVHSAFEPVQSAAPQAEPPAAPAESLFDAAATLPESALNPDAGQQTDASLFTQHGAAPSPQPPAQPPQEEALFGDMAAPAQDALFAEQPQPDQEAASLFDAPAQAPGQPDMFSTAVIKSPPAREEQPEYAPAQPTPRPAQQPRQAEARTAGAQRPQRVQDYQAQAASQTAQQPYPQQQQQQPYQQPMGYGQTQESMPAAKPRRSTPQPPPVNLPPEPVKKTNWLVRVLVSIALVIVFVAVTLCTIFIILYFQNKPSKVVESFTEAIASQDVSKLEGLTTVTGLKPDAEDWAAFCAAFSNGTKLNELKGQLNLIAEDSAAVDINSQPFPAVTIESKPFIWFIERYQIKIQAVSMQVPNAADGTTVRLDMKDHTGMSDGAGGMVYQGLMPGRYQCRIVPPGVDATTIPAVDIEMFGVSGPNLMQGETPRADITVENCVSDSASIYVDDQMLAVLPVEGVVSIPNVAVGSTIRIEAVMDGAQVTSSVVFSDAGNTALRFENYTSNGEAMPEEVESSSSSENVDVNAADLNSSLGSFYQSYLQCINDQSIDAIKSSTSSNNGSLSSRIKTESNAANLFEYTGATVKESSIKTIDGADKPTVQFNASFQYKYKPREGEGDYTDGSNYQSVEMVYEDGQWLVNKITLVSEGDYNSDVIAGFN